MITARYVIALPQFKAFNVLKAIKGGGANNIAVISHHRPRRGHIYVAAIAAVGKRWRSFCRGIKWSIQKL